MRQKRTNATSWGLASTEPIALLQDQEMRRSDRERGVPCERRSPERL
jgi:hypothetical protein